MATNKVFDKGTRLSYAASALLPASGVTSGDPVVAGSIPGVALIDETNSAVTVDHEGVYELSVKGIDGSGNSAVAVGDILYFVNADTPKISKKNTGVRFGYALEAVASAGTATIKVKLGY